MKYKKNHKRFSVIGRGEYLSKADFIEQYYLQPEQCKEYFFDMKWSTGWTW